MTGQTISHFKVLEKLGAGGMGEVYLAEDTKLDRQVALKVLPPHALASEDDRARFYREARAAAALNHANIGHVYEIDETTLAGGETRPFIAMEYVEGESLAERISRGPLPLREVTSIGAQIASGLAAAHLKDIVHRDVKPSNVMLTKAGEAKILDFGLAKTAASTKLTRMGSTLGTFAYMSPEQARGEEVDVRTDVWSLGAVLYEMITGRVPFPGEYEQAVVYGILNEEPQPPTALRTGVPMELERIVLKCLSKNRRHRYQHVDEMAVDLGAVAPSTSGVTRAVPSAQLDADGARNQIRWLVPWILGTGIIGIALGFAAARLTSGDSSRMSTYPVHFTVPVETGGNLDFLRRPLDISRNGRYIAYAARNPVSSRDGIYLRHMAAPTVVYVPESAGGNVPFFSPDERFLGFFVGGDVRRYDIEDQHTVTLARLGRTADGAVWSTDDRILISSFPATLSLDVVGGQIDTLLNSTDWHTYPQYLANFGSTLTTLVQSWKAYDGTAALLLDGENWPAITTVRGTGFRYVSSGHLLFLRQEGLFMAAFDARRGEVTGTPRLIVPGVRETTRYGPGYAVSETGTLIYASSQEARFVPVLVTAEGEEESLPIVAAEYWYPRVLRSGKEFVATVESEGGFSIWVYDLNTADARRLTFDASLDTYPVIFPDGERFAYSSDTDDGWNTFIRRLDGTGKPERVLDGSARSISEDGTLISHNISGDLFVLDLSSGERQQLTDTGSTEFSPMFSPTGPWLAYVSDESGKNEVWLRRYRDGARFQVSTGGGVEPVWSTDGKTLFFRTSSHMMAAAIDHLTGQPSSALPLFEDHYVPDPWGIANYDVDPASGRFLMLKSVESGETSEIHVVLNAFSDPDFAVE